MITLDKKIPVELPTGLFSTVQKLSSVDESILDLQDLVFNISVFSLHYIFKLTFKCCYGNSDIL